MLRSLMFICCIACTTFAYAQNNVQQSNNGVYGEAITGNTSERNLDKILEDGIGDETVVVSAMVVDVSPQDGSWMTVRSDSGLFVRVVMKAHTFSVPSSLKGKSVLISGKLTMNTTTEEQRKDIARELNASQEEIDEISGDVIEYLLTATGVTEQ